MTVDNGTHTPGTYFFFNLGCPKNLVDAERVAAGLEACGWLESPVPEKATLLVVTTCAFIGIAEEESVNEILRVASGKGAEQKLVVLGCLVSREGDALGELLPEVDLFLDVSEMDLLPQRLGARGAFPDAEQTSTVTARKLFTPSHIAYLKIADGCSNHCTYCTIPRIRGELSSRSRESLLDEASLLAAQGVREFTVVAQDTAAWGFDRDAGSGLYRLLEELADIMGTGWVRLMYLNPSHMDVPGIVDLCNRGALCRYLDVPVQHASDGILGRMRRGYGKEDLVRLFADLRSSIEGLVLRTTVMVGFPGETEDDFGELACFLEDVAFDHVGVFAYSEEALTPAARFRDKVEREEAERRKSTILDIQMDISAERLSERVGADETILVDEVFKEGERPAPSIWGVGRYYGQAYEVDGVTFLTGKQRAPGEFVNARIEEHTAYDLIARIGNLD